MGKVMNGTKHALLRNSSLPSVFSYFIQNKDEVIRGSGLHKSYMSLHSRFTCVFIQRHRIFILIFILLFMSMYSQYVILQRNKLLYKATSNYEQKVIVVSKRSIGETASVITEGPYPGLTYHIGVLSSWKFVSTRMSALYHTWGKEAANLSLYVGRSKIENKPSKYLSIQVLTEVEDAVYPPQRKAFEMLQFWCDNLLDDFQWFIRADDDIYMKIGRLERFLYALNHTQIYYIGRSGFGLPYEQDALGLYGNRFCCGPTVIYSKPALQELCPHVKECASDTMSSHEDTEVGRCVFNHLKIQCANNSMAPSLQGLFYHKYSYLDPEQLRGDLTNEEFFLRAISIHEVKDNDVMYNLAYNDLITRKQMKYISNPVKHMSNPYHVETVAILPNGNSRTTDYRT